MDPVIHLFVLAGFLFMAVTFLTLERRRWWIPGLSILCFAIALVLHIIGMVSP